MSIQVSHTAISAASKAPTSYIQPSRILKSMLISNNSLSKADHLTNNNPLFQMITRAQPPFTRALMLTTILTKPRISTQLIICLSIRCAIASLASLITTSRKMVEQGRLGIETVSYYLLCNQTLFHLRRMMTSRRRRIIRKLYLRMTLKLPEHSKSSSLTLAARCWCKKITIIRKQATR